MMGMSNMQQPSQQGNGKGYGGPSNQMGGPRNYGGRPINTIAQPTDGMSDNSMEDFGPQMGSQPRYGQPSQYSNTVQPWDNASIAPQASNGKGQSMQGGGKGQQGGKGQSMQPMQQGGGKGQSMYPTAPTAPATIAGNYPAAATNFQYNPNTVVTPTPVVNTPEVNTSYINTDVVPGGGTGF